MCYGLCAVIGLPFMIFPILREVQKEPVLLIGGNLFATSGLDRLWITNLGRLWEAGTAYFGMGAVLIALALVGRLIVRRQGEALFLLSGDAAAVERVDWLRRASVEPLLAAGAGPADRAGGGGDLGCSGVIRSRWGRRGWSIGGAVGLWIVVIAGPFIRAAWDNPLDLRLPERDRWEYFTNTSSGYGITEAARVLPTLARSPVSGRVPVASTTVECHALRLFLPEDGVVDLSCPFFGWHGEHMDAVIEHIRARLEIGRDAVSADRAGCAVCGYRSNPAAVETDPGGNVPAALARRRGGVGAGRAKNGKIQLNGK